MIPVIDLFAGPGGLGEGFSSFKANGESVFSLALSIEKDAWAHQTLMLRALRRRCDRRMYGHYARYVNGELSDADLFARFPAAARQAAAEAWHLELSAETASDVAGRIRETVNDDNPWVLIGGPPCQAYSLVGRSRNKGRSDYSADEDVKQTLYVEYLQVLARHAPPVFVMENVKGLLSAQRYSQRMFERIQEDLQDPVTALTREGRPRGRRRPRYVIRPVAAYRAEQGSFDFVPDPRDYVVRSERHGLPQARHRVILLGVEESLADRYWKPLKGSPATRTVGDAIGDLPELRGGVSRGFDSPETWKATLENSLKASWLKEVSPGVKSEIRDVVKNLKLPPADRGAVSAARGRIWNHVSRSHMPSDLHRYLFASCYARVFERSPDLREFPASLRPAHKNVDQAVDSGLFGDRFRVQLKDAPSSTITSHIAKDGHYYIHYDPAQCRSLTVREAARLQTFPDDYFFCGPRTSQYQQVGNAVPPALARQIAGIVAAIIE
jgi:DNA (cytosine-5)-methyltransferase 1